MIDALLENAPTLVAVLLALLAIYKAGPRVERMADAVERGMVQDAVTNWRAWGMATLYALAASLQALADVAREMGWPRTAAVARFLQPGLVAAIAYINKSPELVKPATTPAP